MRTRVRNRYFRAWAVGCAFLVTLFVMPTSAKAGDCHEYRSCESNRCGSSRYESSRCGDRHGRVRGRDCYDTCRPRSRLHGYGSSWRVLRAHIRARRAVRQAYFHHYFIRRFARGAHSRHALRPNVLVKPSSTRWVARPYLDRGLARFHFAEYRGAREDFDAILVRQPKNIEALYGRTMSSLCLNEWERAVEDIRRLASYDELKRGDRLAADELFAKSRALPSLLQGLTSYRRYNPMDGDARIASVWLNWITGDLDRAREVHAFASQKSPKDKLLQHLGALLKSEPGTPNAKPTPAAEQTPVKKGEERAAPTPTDKPLQAPPARLPPVATSSTKPA